MICPLLTVWESEGLRIYVCVCVLPRLRNAVEALYMLYDEYIRHGSGVVYCKQIIPDQESLPAWMVIKSWSFAG